MIRLLALIITIFTLTSCARFAQAPVAPTTPALSWPERQAMLSRVQQFWLSGKLAVRTQQDAGSASVTWSQRAARYALSLSGPLGSHAMTLDGSPGQVTLKTSDGKTYRASSPEQLLAKQWGYRLPISNMTYWVRGIPAPGSPANTHLDTRARLQSLIQQGYRITYSDYALFGNLELPTRMTITSSGLNVKIIIYQWRLTS